MTKRTALAANCANLTTIVVWGCRNITDAAMTAQLCESREWRRQMDKFVL